MPRALTQQLATMLGQDWLESHSFLRLFLTNGQSFYWATQRDTIDGFAYSDDLISVGPFKYSLGGAADRVEATVQNVTMTLGISLLAASERLTGAQAEAGRYWRDLNSPNTNARTLLKGIVVGANADENELRLNIVSDAYSGEHIAGQRLVARACQWKYKSVPCGATDPRPTCNKLYDDPGGCVVQHRFGGFIFDTSKSSLVVTINTGSGTSGGDIPGDGYGGGNGGDYGYGRDGFMNL